MDEKKILEGIKKIAPNHCDNCGTKYMPNDFKILKLTGTNALIHLNCAHCGNTYVINAFLNNNGVGSQRIPLVTDLEGPVEIERFAKKDAISDNDAVDLFDYLSSGPNLGQLLSKDVVNHGKKLNINMQSTI